MIKIGFELPMIFSAKIIQSRNFKRRERFNLITLCRSDHDIHKTVTRFIELFPAIVII